VEKILVTYASKHGATEEIARKMGEVLRQAGLQADVLPVDNIRDLSPYKAVVLGSAVYVGKWQKEAVEFLQTNEKILADRPVWLFSSGPTGQGDSVELVQGWRLPTALQPVVDRIKPRDIAVFHGSLDPKKLNFIERGMTKAVKAAVGDFRDWDMMVTWTNTIANTLKALEL
jgi:menaquinone-dependent protoporphyrinogen oxidase